MKTGLDAINEVLLPLAKEKIEIVVSDFDFGYEIVGSPTVNKSPGFAFCLNSPAKVVLYKNVEEYCDRVFVENNSTKDFIKAVSVLLEDRAEAYRKSHPGAKFNSHPYFMPGYENGVVARPTEDGLGFELQYYIATFKVVEA